MPKTQVLHIKPRLPEALEGLRTLAMNLHWTWDWRTAELFQDLDPDLWDRVKHNPVLLLGSMDQRRLEKLAGDRDFLKRLKACEESLTNYLKDETWFQRTYPQSTGATFAYFSAEFGIHECVPFYSGGLGVLAGDHLKSASDLGVPLVGVGLAYHQGYFRQYLNADGWQQEAYVDHDFYNLPMSLVKDDHGQPLKVEVEFPDKNIVCYIWKLEVGRISLYLLDTNVHENDAADRPITRRLYGGNKETRIRQEMILGIGGLRALKAMGIEPTVCHMNEGHAAFLGMERVRQTRKELGLDYQAAQQMTSASCLFTTHTPVPAGFDLFEPDLMQKYFSGYMNDLGISFDEFMALGRVNPEDHEQPFNMALFATRHAAFRNGVSELHGRVSREMMQPWWPGYPAEEVPVDSVTNGIHLQSWVAPPMQEAYEKVVGKGWTVPTRNEPDWSAVHKMKDKDIWENHLACKERFVQLARKRAVAHAKARGSRHEMMEAKKILDPKALTIGFARRFATYKRATLLLRDRDRLKRLMTNTDRPIQFVFAGKAHPADAFGKELIKDIVHYARDSHLTTSFVFIENYDIEVGRHVVAGVDVWLNNPRRPLEASGTSGMKAAANGVLNLSILDGWWVEGYETERGWAIGDGEEYSEEHYQDSVEASALYDLLEHEVIPTYYDRDGKDLPTKWIQKMKASMAELGPFFNTNRMVGEYAEKFYVRAASRSHELTDGNLDRVHSLVDWSRRVSERWNQVQVAEVVHRNGGDLHVGAEIPVRVKVNLGDLSPSDVSVELYHGSADGDHRVLEGNVTPMKHEGEEHGHHLYQGTLTCGISGLYGYSVRIVPAHPDALVPNELSLITWY